MSKSLTLLAMAAVSLLGLAPSPAGQFTFLPPSTSTTSWFPSNAQVGDINGDGVADVLVMDNFPPGAGKLREFLGNGDGSFTLVPVDVGAAASFIRLVDTNKDGLLDLVVLGGNGSSNFGVLPGDGAGGFGPFIGSDAGPYPTEFALGQLDADGVPDAVVMKQSVFPQALRVLMGDGAGGFVQRQTLPYSDPFDGQLALSFGDFDEDGWQDLAAGTNGVVWIYRGLGDGWLDTEPLAIPYTAIAFQILVADFDADGHLDLAVSAMDWYTTNEILVSRGHGDGSFDAPIILPTGVWFGYIAAGDIDGDADLDLLAQEFDWEIGSTLVAFVNAGDGSFTPGLKLTVSTNPQAAAAEVQLADLDGDSHPDLVTSIPSSAVEGTLLVALNRSYLPGSPFSDLGSALQGATGWPILLAEGSLAPTAEASLSLWNGLGGAPLYAVAGSSAVFAPFRGGTLVPAPELVTFLGTAAAAGPTTVSFRAPPGLSGLSLYVQFWLADAAAVHGFAATTGVRMQFP